MKNWISRIYMGTNSNLQENKNDSENPIGQRKKRLEINTRKNG
jgi:hypothetical protein